MRGRNGKSLNSNQWPMRFGPESFSTSELYCVVKQHLTENVKSCGMMDVTVHQERSYVPWHFCHRLCPNWSQSHFTVSPVPDLACFVPSPVPVHYRLRTSRLLAPPIPRLPKHGPKSLVPDSSGNSRVFNVRFLQRLPKCCG